ncbi:hypothetical protein D3C77_432990 [compost metagenome]
MNLAQGRWMHPAPFWIVQPATGQAYPGYGLGLFTAQASQQLRVEGFGQQRLTLVFLGIEGQLQNPATIPVTATLQRLKQAPGVTEATEDQARQGGAMGGKLEVEHPLRVTRCFGRWRCMALQNLHLPAARCQARRRGATGQARADDQGLTRAGQGCGAGEPRGTGWQLQLGGAAAEGASQDLPLLADTGYALHVEAYGD